MLFLCRFPSYRCRHHHRKMKLVSVRVELSDEMDYPAASPHLDEYIVVRMAEFTQRKRVLQGVCVWYVRWVHMIMKGSAPCQRRPRQKDVRSALCPECVSDVKPASQTCQHSARIRLMICIFRLIDRRDRDRLPFR